MKKMMSSVLAAGMVLSSIPVSGVQAMSLNDTIVQEKEANNEKDSAQVLSLVGSNSVAKEVTNFVEGSFSSVGDVDWYKVTLAEPGKVNVSFHPEDKTGTIPKDNYPDVDIFSTRYDGSFGTVAYPDDASQRIKDSADGNVYSWYSHINDNDVFIRVKKNEESNSTYNMGIVYGVNSPSGDTLEPNTVFNKTWDLYESALIEKNTWINTKWNNHYDEMDNFSIEASSKGKLTYSVKYDQEEYNYWNEANKDYYNTYGVYAELKDGSYDKIDGEAVIGIPNQTYSKSLEIENSNYTGKFVLSLKNGFLKNPNYQVKMDFEGDVQEPEKDTTPPKEVSGLEVSSLTKNSVKFNFALPSDTDFDKVLIYRDGSKISESNTGTFEDTALTADKDYSYKFVTVDTTGNTSVGVSKNITTLPEPVEVDTTAPSEISDILVNELSHERVTFNYTLPTDKDFDKVVIYRDGKQIAETQTNSFTDIELNENTSYTYKFITVDETGNSSKGSIKSITTKEKPSIPQPEPTELEYKRISGDDRYETSKAFSQEIPAHSLDTVLLASGSDFPDALTGGVLNNKMNGIVLLVRDNQAVINEQLKEAKRVLKDNGKVVLLGGDAAVSPKIEKAFAKEFETERLGGKTRFQTALKIADKVNDNPEEIVLTYGMDFADALSVVPYATKKEIPIMLNTKGDKLQEDVASYISSKKNTLKKVTIIGGTGVVPTSVEKELNKLGIKTIDRISGEDRYITSLEIAKKLYPETKSIALTNAFSFADALSGSRFAFDHDLPVLLTAEDSIEDEVVTHLKGNVESVYLYGGNSVVSESIKKQLKK
ncbi:cell wall-binding repeat-containing protein [Anaerobacillus sp. 1_MG-2023]|uniref:cell wall-binding repeat-containing protein n=1 Tax=Anaerobacillus sp. 1_MG-2023 TaxID=3062655 RepID=UPI0026E44CE8|nr:cell wall-binding repeat-containing protein [Anaerobacillus sp. 1_MG-2023]MDO6657503.1 cell wall-binding repeat-containing protein [Anaerobacillus sp. 1_MG-2023]